jgi:hypothetical protein
MELKRLKYAYAKGLVFTLEALISLILIFYIFSIINITNLSKDESYKLIFLNDVYTILERNHPDLAFFAKSGLVNDNLKNLIEEIKIVSNKSFSIENERGIKTKNCDGSYSIERAIMTTDGPKKIRLIYCD